MIQEKCRSPGSEALPEGIVSKTSDLEMRPLWGPVSKDVSKITAIIQCEFLKSSFWRKNSLPV